MKAVPSTESVWAHLSADLKLFIQRRVSDEHVADDLLQEVFIRIHRNIETLQQTDRLAAWVYKIARNVIQDHYRSGTHRTESLEIDPAANCSDSQEACSCRSGSWLDEMIRSLDDGYRQALELAEIQGISQQEVGDRMGLSLSAAKSRIQRGRAMLKESLTRCCDFQFDRRGRMTDCIPKPGGTCGCECD
jgi:RNA polymerase sigma-70 factor (ECF subfamily)